MKKPIKDQQKLLDLMSKGWFPKVYRNLDIRTHYVYENGSPIKGDEKTVDALVAKGLIEVAHDEPDIVLDGVRVSGWTSYRLVAPPVEKAA